MAAAWKRVKANAGSAGVDGRTVQQTGNDLVTEWADTRQALLDGTYRPWPVRRVAIPKPGGKTTLPAHPVEHSDTVQRLASI